MTDTSRKWRDKKINRIRVYRKIHNSVLLLITEMMLVFFLITLCSRQNQYSIVINLISLVWLSLIAWVNM